MEGGWCSEKIEGYSALERGPRMLRRGRRCESGSQGRRCDVRFQGKSGIGGEDRQWRASFLEIVRGSRDRRKSGNCYRGYG